MCHTGSEPMMMTLPSISGPQTLLLATAAEIALVEYSQVGSPIMIARYDAKSEALIPLHSVGVLTSTVKPRLVAATASGELIPPETVGLRITTEWSSDAC